MFTEKELLLLKPIVDKALKDIGLNEDESELLVDALLEIQYQSECDSYVAHLDYQDMTDKDVAEVVLDFL